MTKSSNIIIPVPAFGVFINWIPPKPWHVMCTDIRCARQYKRCGNRTLE